MQEFGITRALMWPTLSSVIEQAMPDDPLATHAVLQTAPVEPARYQHGRSATSTIFPTPGDRYGYRPSCDRGA